MQKLKEKLEHALQNFNYADENYIDAAIMDLNAAEEKIRARIREVKNDDNKRNNKETRGIKATLSRVCNR